MSEIPWKKFLDKVNCVTEWNHLQQVVGCVPPAFLIRGGEGVSIPLLHRDPHGQRPPWTETPQKEHGTRVRDPPRRNMRTDSQTGSDIIQRPPRGWKNTCENITLPQTSFAGGKYQKEHWNCWVTHLLTRPFRIKIHFLFRTEQKWIRKATQATNTGTVKFSDVCLTVLWCAVRPERR